MGPMQYTKPLELYDAIEGMRSDGSTIMFAPRLSERTLDLLRAKCSQGDEEVTQVRSYGRRGGTRQPDRAASPSEYRLYRIRYAIKEVISS